ncbi:MAG TPA: hypothetical protein VF526_18815 [Solirubrobacteraceae bacterium]
MRAHEDLGIYIWQNMAVLDAIGPQQILGVVPEFKVVTVAEPLASRDRREAAHPARP